MKNAFRLTFWTHCLIKVRATFNDAVWVQLCNVQITGIIYPLYWKGLEQCFQFWYRLELVHDNIILGKGLLRKIWTKTVSRDKDYSPTYASTTWINPIPFTEPISCPRHPLIPQTNTRHCIFIGECCIIPNLTPVQWPNSKGERRSFRDDGCFYYVPRGMSISVRVIEFMVKFKFKWESRVDASMFE